MRKKGFVPLYRKNFYEFYIYDRNKFTSIYKKINELCVRFQTKKFYYNVNPLRVLSLCYIRDANNKLQKKYQLEDNHIFRIKNLMQILDLLAQIIIEKIGTPTPETIEYCFNKLNLAIYIEETTQPQAELIDFIKFDIKTRIKAHIFLIRALKYFDIEDAIQLTRLEYNLPAPDNYAQIRKREINEKKKNKMLLSQCLYIASKEEEKQET